MKLQLSRTPGLKLFSAHGPGYVMVGAERHEKPVVVTPQEVRIDWPAPDFSRLEEAHFAWFLAFTPEVVLLGTGQTQKFPHPRLYRALTDARIALECMDTPAACRTYDILVSEDRRVVAAILF